MSETSNEAIPSSLMPLRRALPLLGPQLLVAVLAFIALSCVGELHQVYRNMILDFQDGSRGFVVAVISIIFLSLLIWSSSLIVLRWQTPGGSIFFRCFRFLECFRGVRVAR